IVSESIARMAPAATAVVAAITSGENLLKTEYPTTDATDEIIAIPAQTPKTYPAERPAFFIPAELDNPSGRLDKKIAATATIPTEPPPISVTPMAIDSGMPSINAPNA